MLRSYFLIILSIIFFTSCEYKPIYSAANKFNYDIVITEIIGDKNLNKFLIENLTKNSQTNSDKKIYVKINTTYSKIILAKNAAGTVTNYQSKATTTFIIDKEQEDTTFTVEEKFDYQKMSDQYEEKNYENNIKKNLATSISQKLIFKLSIPQ